MLLIREITATHQTEQNSKVSLRITLKLQTLITPSQQFVKMSSRKNWPFFYNDFKSEDGKLKTVYLLFDTTEDGDTFWPLSLKMVFTS